MSNFAIYDYYDSESNVLGMTIRGNYNKVKLNDYYFVSMTTKERAKTIIHELGHILGLNEFTNKEDSFNVMVQGRREYVQLGPADIAVYYYLWS